MDNKTKRERLEFDTTIAQHLVREGVLQVAATMAGARLPHGPITPADMQKLGRFMIYHALDDDHLSSMDDYVKLRLNPETGKPAGPYEKSMLGQLQALTYDPDSGESFDAQYKEMVGIRNRIAKNGAAAHYSAGNVDGPFYFTLMSEVDPQGTLEAAERL